ncbi:MAG TPA: cupin domain-containing protein [Ktedonobacteraceae bacterium]|nr:cupin domain-containing protein [Ktedonobacteraceae bacterium]
MQVSREDLLVKPGMGETVALGGVGVIFKVFGPLTGGALSIVEHPVAPGTLAMPHTHHGEDELSYVLEGEVGVKIGDLVVQATAGSYVFKPRGIPHTFWNAGPGPARLLEIICPAGFETYFREMARLLQPSGPPDPEQVAALAEKYGLTYHPEWIEELATAFHVKLLG